MIERALENKETSNNLLKGNANDGAFFDREVVIFTKKLAGKIWENHIPVNLRSLASFGVMSVGARVFLSDYGVYSGWGNIFKMSAGIFALTTEVERGVGFFKVLLKWIHNEVIALERKEEKKGIIPEMLIYMVEFGFMAGTAYIALQSFLNNMDGVGTAVFVVLAGWVQAKIAAILMHTMNEVSKPGTFEEIQKSYFDLERATRSSKKKAS